MITNQTVNPTEKVINEKYREVRLHSVAQCKPLLIEDYIPQPVPFVSPPKWHLGHTTWFFEEFVLKRHYEDYQEFDRDFSFIFNSYYNLVGDRIFRADRGNLTRPSVEEVYNYRRYVDEHMEKLLLSNGDDIQELVVLGLNHEQQHQELFLTDLKYILGHNPLFPVYNPEINLTASRNQDSGFLKVAGGKYEIGFEGSGFCYDNELSHHVVFLHEYEIGRSLVTNAEYLEFVNDGGYQNSNLWLDEGWSWVQENGIKGPKYWHKIDGEWHHFTLSGLKKLEGDHILCHVSYYEAAAFAEWKQMRLPTEFEWEAASSELEWGHRWEWTGSAYLPYPGFEKPAGAVGEYNGKFMINQMVLRGASTATSPDHSRSTYRNFFHPHFQWQFSGIRLAKKQVI